MNILCFGDSNTHGYNPRNEKRYEKNVRWTGILQNLLTNEHYVIEEGLGGRTTVFEDPITEGLSSINYIIPCMRSHQPLDLLIIMLGTNDTKERFNASASVISLGLERIIKKIQNEKESFYNNKPNILIIAPPKIKEGINDVECYSRMGKDCVYKSSQIGALYEDVAKRLGCMYLDASKDVQFSDIDCMHLDEDNHLILAHKIYDTIIENIKELS